jgi:uroporphyrinogen decarboxylase
MRDFQDLISIVREPVAERPLVAIWDYAPCHASLVGGIPDMRRYYLDVEEKFSTQLRLKQRYPEVLILPGIWPDLGVIIETSAFGGQITWFENGAPYIAPSIHDLNQIDRLKMPNPANAGLVPLYLVQMKQMQQLLMAKGEETEKLVISMGPAELAGLILGYDRYFLGLYEDPKRVGTLMEGLTEFIIKWLHVQEETNGQAQLLILADHTPSQVKPEQMEGFILPHIKAIFEEFPYAVKLYHNEGFHTDKHIALIRRFGFDIWHFGSDQHDLAELYPRLDERTCLFGGLNPHGVLRKGTPEDVSRETEACLKAARGRRLILSSGTGTTPDVPPENIEAMVKTATG